MNPITEPVKITSLELENVKRIRACAITPTQNGLTVIGGRNNQGKTSVLDAIAWALGGDRHRPSRQGTGRFIHSAPSLRQAIQRSCRGAHREEQRPKGHGH